MNRYDMKKHLPKPGRGMGGASQMAMREVPPGTPIQVDLNTATKQSCECGGEVFVPAIQVYKVSALISPTGQELIANQQVIICAKCSKIFEPPK